MTTTHRYEDTTICRMTTLVFCDSERHDNEDDDNDDDLCLSYMYGYRMILP
jgi:hypothetical protein